MYFFLFKFNNVSTTWVGSITIKCIHLDSVRQGAVIPTGWITKGLFEFPSSNLHEVFLCCLWDIPSIWLSITYGSEVGSPTLFIAFGSSDLSNTLRQQRGPIGAYGASARNSHPYHQYCQCYLGLWKTHSFSWAYSPDVTLVENVTRSSSEFHSTNAATGNAFCEL
jgi:hypothetical protein